MRLSIVIPTRNEARCIGAAIEQYAPFFEEHGLEVIVSDANSTDGTADIVRALMKKHPGRILLTQKPGRQNIAIGRNLGAAVASGDVLLHTDADVRLPAAGPFFEKTLARFAAAPRLVAATVPLHVYAEEARAADRFYHFLMNATVRFSIWTGWWCLSKGECQLVRREAFEEVGGYDERLVAGEDCNLFHRLRRAGRVAFFADIEVRHSPRRFRQLGYWRVSYDYFMEWVTRGFFGRSHAREWRAVR